MLKGERTEGSRRRAEDGGQRTEDSRPMTDAQWLLER